MQSSTGLFRLRIIALFIMTNVICALAPSWHEGVSWITDSHDNNLPGIFV
jgi:hypothetical protein